MAATDEIVSTVERLNALGFAQEINCDKVLEAAARCPPEKALQILQDLESHQNEVKDPTAWVTSAMRKASGGASGGGSGGSRGGMGGMPQSGGAADSKLRKRINWLNGDGGGFEGAILYDKVLAAAGGLPYDKVMHVLKELEEKKDVVKDPNAWVCSALRKAGGGNPQAPPQAFPAAAWAAPPAAAAWGAPLAQASWASAQPNGSTREGQSKVHKRVTWLNGTGGFEGALVTDKVIEAAAGVDTEFTLKVLKDLEEKRDTVKDPTAYVTSALRKAAARQRPALSASPAYAAPAPSWPGGGFGGGASGWTPDAQSQDQALRKKIGFLNKSVFGGALKYDKILEAAGGLEFSKVFELLDQVQERVGQVQDPTGWVVVGLKKASQRGGGFAPAPMAAQPVYHAPPQQFGGPMPMSVDSMDPESESKLHKRIKWLNGTGGFGDSISFEDVKKAARGLPIKRILEIVKDLEEKKDEVRDATAFVTNALRKAGGGGGGGGGKGMAGPLGVRRTIGKK